MKARGGWPQETVWLSKYQLCSSASMKINPGQLDQVSASWTLQEPSCSLQTALSWYWPVIPPSPQAVGLLNLFFSIYLSYLKNSDSLGQLPGLPRRPPWYLYSQVPSTFISCFHQDSPLGQTLLIYPRLVVGLLFGNCFRLDSLL